MNIRILVVEDSPSIRQMISIALKSASYLVTTVESGQAALALCERMLFDLIITDQDMTKMDGLTLIGSIRNLNCYRDVPILLITKQLSFYLNYTSFALSVLLCLNYSLQVDKFH